MRVKDKLRVPASVRGRRVERKKRRRDLVIFFFEQSARSQNKKFTKEKKKKKLVVAAYREDAKAGRARVLPSACRAPPGGGAKL